MKKRQLLFLTLILAFIGIYGRMHAHPANFAPMTAIAMFAGAYLPKKWSIILPLFVLLFTDLFLGFYEIGVMLAVYGCLVLAVAVGWQLKKKIDYLSIISGSLACSIIFFLITNLAVWLFSSWYPHNIAGLSLSYYLALPFFRNTLFSDMFFMAAFFGSYELLSNLSWQKRAKENI